MAEQTGRTNTLEVELKYPVENLLTVRQQLEALGGKSLSSDWENDIYFCPPKGNYVDTDEALRLRRTGEKLLLTYKGPRSDPHSKSRPEIEVELRSPAFFDQACLLLEHLGYYACASLTKERSNYELCWQGYAVKVSLDNVQNLGTFVELETKVPADQLQPARTALEHLAKKLGLRNAERRSYLELYFDRQWHYPHESPPPPI